jgi:hypothetical protein
MKRSSALNGDVGIDAVTDAIGSGVKIEEL